MGISNSTSCFIFSAALAFAGAGLGGESAFAQHAGGETAGGEHAGGEHAGADHSGHGDHGSHGDKSKHEAHHATLPEASGSEQLIKVKGMVCEICAAGIKKKLLKEKEVKSVDVKIKEHQVKITYKDPKQTLSRDRLGVILKEAGYELN